MFIYERAFYTLTIEMICCLLSNLFLVVRMSSFLQVGRSLFPYRYRSHDHRDGNLEDRQLNAFGVMVVPACGPFLVKYFLVRALSQDGDSVDALPVHLAIFTKNIRKGTSRNRTDECRDHLGWYNMHGQHNWKRKAELLSRCITFN